MASHLSMDVNGTALKDTSPATAAIADELKLGILKICLFSTFFVLGLIGNSLVLIGIGLNKGMQTPTNLLIFNLALADILFIIVCIPTTLFGLFGLWPFAEFGCKLAQFINHLSAFMSIYLLVSMSIDRYLAIVHAVGSKASYRTTKNTTTCIIALWLIGICLSMIIGSLFTVIKYEGDQSTVSMYCMLRYLKLDAETLPSVPNNTELVDIMNSGKSTAVLNRTMDTPVEPPVQILPIEASLYWLGFVVFLYALPLTIIVILYGLMLRFLRGSRGQSVGKSKRRATRMILAVILTYALCWFLMQLLFISNMILSRNPRHSFANYMDILTMFANVFAYLNSCTNPILYGFMSKNFRSSFIDLLCCRYAKRRRYGTNNSQHTRSAPENKYFLQANSQKSDCTLRTSVLSRYSQYQAVPNANSAFSPRLTTESAAIFDQNEPILDDKNLSMDNLSSCQINVGTQTNIADKPHRRRKHDDRSSMVGSGSILSLPASETSQLPGT